MRLKDSAVGLGSYAFFLCKTILTVLYARPVFKLPEPQNEDVYFITNLLFQIVQIEAGELTDGVSTNLVFRNAIEKGSPEEVHTCLSIHDLNRGQLMMLICHLVESHSSLDNAIKHIKSFPDEVF